jgi:uncharacterized SAM-binding protein YcdF (DUF218 family)
MPKDFAQRMFELKKFISFWLMPLPFCLTLLTAGLLLLIGTQRARLARGFLVVGVILLALFANKMVSVALVQPIEATFPPIPDLIVGHSAPADLGRCRYVVVLGSGHSDAPGFSANNQLSSAGLARIVEGVRLLKVLPEARLVLSGGGEPGYPSHAVVLGRVAAQLGVEPERILRIENVRDTEDESKALSELIGPAPIALVSSAWHLPRASALFRTMGFDVLPCPTAYTARPSPNASWNEYSWSIESLERSTAAVRERIGFIWLRLRGKV